MTAPRVEDAGARHIAEKVEDGRVQERAAVEATIVAEAVVELVREPAVLVDGLPIGIADLHPPMMPRLG